MDRDAGPHRLSALLFGMTCEKSIGRSDFGTDRK